jgi:hypothetical protein
MSTLKTLNTILDIVGIALTALALLAIPLTVIMLPIALFKYLMAM